MDFELNDSQTHHRIIIGAPKGVWPLTIKGTVLTDKGYSNPIIEVRLTRTQAERLIDRLMDELIEKE